MLQQHGGTLTLPTTIRGLQLLLTSKGFMSLLSTSAGNCGFIVLQLRGVLGASEVMRCVVTYGRELQACIQCTIRAALAKEMYRGAMCMCVKREGRLSQHCSLWAGGIAVPGCQKVSGTEQHRNPASFRGGNNKRNTHSTNANVTLALPGQVLHYTQELANMAAPGSATLRVSVPFPATSCFDAASLSACRPDSQLVAPSAFVTLKSAADVAVLRAAPAMTRVAPPGQHPVW